jgi:radical S-adenosyl methionine domain-containing protein 2
VKAVAGVTDSSPACPESVNWFLSYMCNYHCDFCYATPDAFDGPSPRPGALHISMEQAHSLLRKLRDAGTRKLTFVGGEPTLVSALPVLVGWTAELQMAPMIVTNGTGLTNELLDQLTPHLTHSVRPGAIKLSVESSSESTEAKLGRGSGHHVGMIRKRAAEIRNRGIPLMANSTVTALNWREDLHELIQSMEPVQRWKVFQVLRIIGQNDRLWSTLEVTAEQFDDFVRRHSDLNPVAENNAAMTSSYVMLDPVGRFFQNSSGRYLTSSHSILDRGVEETLSEVGWSPEKYIARGGRYSVELED